MDPRESAGTLRHRARCALRVEASEQPTAEDAENAESTGMKAMPPLLVRRRDGFRRQNAVVGSTPSSLCALRLPRRALR